MLKYEDRNIIRFTGAAELHDYCLKLWSADQLDRERDWLGGSRRAALDKSIHGDRTNLAAAQAMMAEFDNVVSREAVEEVAEVFGCYPCIPEVLNGEPECMRMPVAMRSEGAPLRIVIDLTTSGGIGHEDIATRGVAALALVWQLSAVRPVELEVCAALGGGERRSGTGNDRVCVASVRINTAPLDLATACYMITSPGFHRGLLYDVLEVFNCGGGWPNLDGCPYGQMSHPDSIARMTAVVAADSGDEVLFLPALSMYESEAVKNPRAWIKRMYDRYSPGYEEPATE
jgi:hypothetical protein